MSKKRNREKVVVLDYATGNVYVFPFPQKFKDDPDEYVFIEVEERYGIELKEETTEYMIVEDLNIQIEL